METRKIGTMFWKYKKIKPQELTHSVTYVSNASDFNPHPSDEQIMLNEYCTAAGWEKICDWNKMNIYCTANTDPVPLDTDEMIRFQNMKSSINKNFLWGNIVLLGIFIFYAYMQGSLLFAKSSGIDLFNFFDRFMLVTFVFSLWGILMQCGILAMWYHWLKKSKQAIEKGGSCYTSSIYLKYNQASFIITICLLFADIIILLSATINTYIIMFILYMLGFGIIVSGMKFTQNLLKKKGVSRKANITITLLIDLLLSILVIGSLSFFFFIVLI